MKLSFLILFFLLLSGAGESGETKSPTSADDQKAQAQKQSTTTQDLPQSTGAPIIIINNPAPTIEQNRPEAKSEKWPPTPLEIISIIIAGGAFIIAWRTLNAVQRQAGAAERTLTSIERQVIANETSANAAKAAADIADRTLQTSERAWLSVTFNKSFKPQHGTVNPVVYSVKNTGKSAAFLKVKCLKSIPWPTSVIPERPLAPKPMGEHPTLMVIFPNDVVELEGIIDIDFRGEFFEQMIAGHKIFDVYGYVAYDDIFKIRHITRFCYAFNPGENINQDTGKFEYIRDPRPEYNDAD